MDETNLIKTDKANKTDLPENISNKEKITSSRLVSFRIWQKNIIKRFLTLEAVMTIKTKIAFGLIGILISLAPVLIFSLWYVNNMRNIMDKIILEDVGIAQTAEDISYNMLLVRRAEKNYLLLKDEKYLIENQNKLAEIDTLAMKIGELSSSDNEQVRKILNAANLYSTAFDSLVIRTRTQDIARYKILREEVAREFRNWRLTYDNLIKQAEAATDSTVQDSLLRAADEHASSFSLDNAMQAREKETDPERALLEQKMETTTNTINNIASIIAKKHWNNMETHRKESIRSNALANRNIITILIFTICASAFLIAYLPPRISKPITHITNIVKRAEKGDWGVTAKSISRDEIGELAIFFNRMMKQVRLNDFLKTQKILSHFHKIELLATWMNEAFIMIDDQNTITLINEKFVDLLGVSESEIKGKTIMELENEEELLNFYKKTMERRKSLQNRELSIGKENNKVLISSYILFNEQMIMDSVILRLTPIPKTNQIA